MDPQLFPDIPADVAALDDDDLEPHRDQLRDRIKQVAASRRDPDMVGQLTELQVTEQMEAAVVALKAIEKEIGDRQAAAAAFDGEVERLAAEAGVDPDDTDDGDDSTDGDTEGATDADGDTETGAPSDAAAAEETVTAAATGRRPLPAARKRHRPHADPVDTRGFRLTQHASAIGLPLDTGTFLDRNALAHTLTEIVRKGRVKPGQTAVVATAKYEYPDDRVLDGGSGAGDTNMEKIQRVTGRTALVASGGLCAPLTPIYDLPGVETSARPVRDALASFQAVRGGVIVGATPTLGDYDDAVGTVTAADNEAGGTLATKNCLRISCPDFESVEVDSIYRCVEADNLASRAYPELMARIDELVSATHARAADSKLLTEIAAGSTAVTGGTVTIGAVGAYLRDILRAAAAIRSRHRMAEAARLRALAPAWIIDFLLQDLAMSQFDRFHTRQDIVNILANAGVTINLYLDGSATATNGQVFGAQTAGALVDWPDTVETFLFPEGTWLHLDAGVLELGVVRDSILNATNDFQIFAETWENVAYVGVESLKITSTVCASGETAGTADSSSLC